MNKRKLPIVLRTLLVSILLVGVTFTTLFAADLLGGVLIPTVYPDGIPPLSGELRAMTVRTQNNADFPSAPGLPTKRLKSELEEIAAFAQTYGYNAIFFEAVPQHDAFYRSSLLPSSAFWTGKQGSFTFFDPLAYLTNLCKELDIQVYAVVDPFDVAGQESLAAKSPALQNAEWVSNGHLDPTQIPVQKLIAKIVGELTAGYDIAGVILSGVDSEAFGGGEAYTQAIAQIADLAHKEIHDKQTQRLGMVVNSDSISQESSRNIVSLPLKKENLDFIVASAQNAQNTDDLVAELDAWSKLCGESALYRLHAASDKSIFSHAIDNSIYFERQNGVDGVVISNYSTLHTEARTAAYSLAATFAQTAPVLPDLSYSQSFSITRPAETLTIGSSMETYFITGTSDPSKPLYYSEKEVERTSSGLWGVQVKVPYGTNTYTFAQDGITKKAVLVRNKPPQDSTISTIPKGSVYPASPEAVLDGQRLKLSCTAPAGATVTASVGGLTATLKQVSQTGKSAVATTYQETLDLSSLSSAGQIKNIGAVTYKLNYNGMNSSQKSTGEVYVAGKDALPVARMKGFIVPVNTNEANDGVYTTVLKDGCVDYIVGNSGGAYYKLASGGYVLKSTVEIPTGTVSAVNSVSSISLKQLPKGEKLRITGTARSVFTTQLTDGRLIVKLENISGFDKLKTELLQSELCTSIETQIDQERTVTLTFTLKEGVELLGWDVQFEGNDTVIYLKQMPTLKSNTAAPLSGITVLLDPGHGGTDPGAAGVPYHEGAWEKTLNLANAYALRSRLEALGASVHITQEDSSMTLNERMELSQKLDADLFISCHHNALSETVDSNTVSGIEVFYYNEQSERFAQNIGESLSQNTGRKLRFVNQSWYRVTMMSACPSVLVESGYLCSPAEYEKLATEFGMYQYANAVSDAVLQYFA